MRKNILGMVVSCALATGGTGCGGSTSQDAKNEDPEARKFEIYDWMAAGREKMAIDSLLSLLRERVPEIVFAEPQYDLSDPPPQVGLAQRIAAGNPPDSFQAIGGADLREWAQRGALAPLDALAVEQNWLNVFPKPVLDSASSNGTLYAVPLNLERDNTLFFNKALFTSNGIAPPTSMPGILDAAKAFEGKGIQPLSVSALGGWTIASMLFEAILVADAGPDFVEDYMAGRLTGDAPEMQVAVTDLARLMVYANPDRGSTGWGEAMGRLCTGEAAMLMMPDFVKSQFDPGCFVPETIGYVTLEPPGAPTFVFVGIVFPLAQNALHPKNGVEFLRVAGSKEGQESFNRLKLSVPPRLDVDVSGFDFISIQETADLRAPGERLVPGYAAQTSAAYQEAVSPALQSFADPASPDHDNVNTLLTVLRNNYAIIRP